jgi:hypothetical protein
MNERYDCAIGAEQKKQHTEKRRDEGAVMPVMRDVGGKKRRSRLRKAVRMQSGVCIPEA